jgi:hypothetical protein
VSFFVVEPQIGQAVNSNTFTIKTSITDEISFLTEPVNVIATTSINGITGGTASGSTTVAVRTNSPGGYYMTIAFANNGTDNAMLGDQFLGESIMDYIPASTTVPDYNFDTSSTSAVFAYTVSALDSADVAQAFLDDDTDCNIPSGGGGAYTEERCWMGPSTSSFEIINRSSSAATGATSTIHFRVYVPNSPTPAVVADTYTATATLTALNQ